MTGKPIPLRVDEALTERIDRVVQTLSDRTEGVHVSRASVMRAALERGIESFERELNLSRTKRKR